MRALSNATEHAVLIFKSNATRTCNADMTVVSSTSFSGHVHLYSTILGEFKCLAEQLVQYTVCTFSSLPSRTCQG